MKIVLWSSCTVLGKSQNPTPILYCKRPILRVEVKLIGVGSAHSSLGQPILYTTSSTYTKMINFWWVVLKWQAVTFSNLHSSTKMRQNWPIKNSYCFKYLLKIANYCLCKAGSVKDWLTKSRVGSTHPNGPYPYPPIG